MCGAGGWVGGGEGEVSDSQDVVSWLLPRFSFLFFFFPAYTKCHNNREHDDKVGPDTDPT